MVDNNDEFEIPTSGIQTEGFQIKSPANLFFLFMLSRNWNAWAAEYKPLSEREVDFENKDDVAEELKLQPSKNYWTIVGVDEGEYVEPGIETLDGNGFYTHGFIETERSPTTLPWSGQWFPRVSADIPGFTIEYRPHELIKTVYMNCELCPADEIDDCDHWDGDTGSWVSVDFELPEASVAEAFLRNIVDNTGLGAFRCIAASVLVADYVNSPERDVEAAQLKHSARDIFAGLTPAERDLVLMDSQVIPELHE